MTDQIAQTQEKSRVADDTVFLRPGTTSDLTPDGRGVIVDFQIAVQGEEWQQHANALYAAINQEDQFSCGGTAPYWDYPEHKSDSVISTAISGGVRLYVRWRRAIDGPTADRATLLKELHEAQQKLLANITAQLPAIKSGPGHD